MSTASPTLPRDTAPAERGQAPPGPTAPDAGGRGSAGRGRAVVDRSHTGTVRPDDGDTDVAAVPGTAATGTPTTGSADPSAPHATPVGGGGSTVMWDPLGDEPVGPVSVSAGGDAEVAIGPAGDSSPPLSIPGVDLDPAGLPAGLHVGQETVLREPAAGLSADGSSVGSVSSDGEARGRLPGGAAARRVRSRLFPPPEEVGAADLAAGCELEQFVVERRIGSGGMGAVFRALDRRLQRVVALKVLSPAHSGDRASVLRFQNEARSAARLDHANIARVFYTGEDRGLHFIAFEFITGRTVRDLIAAQGRLPVSDAVAYVRQVALALRHCAAAGVVHRDVKPSNIIITPAGRAKLVDLGLARKEAADSVGDLTVAGTTLGTFDYIAPEQAKDPRAADVRSDIYSLGCTLYHMLTGTAPYPGGTVLQKLLDHQGKNTPDPRARNGAVPANVAELCRRMMDSDPLERPANPDELLRDLDALAQTRRPAPVNRGIGLLAATGTLLLASVLVAVVVTHRGVLGDAVAAAAGLALPPVADDLYPDGFYPDAPAGERPASGTLGTAVLPRVAELRSTAETGIGRLPPEPLPPPAAYASAADPAAVDAAAVAERAPVRLFAGGASARPFPTLEEALREAGDGDTIELNYDGQFQQLRREVTLGGRSLAVRAGLRPDGTAYRPRILFFPKAQDVKTVFLLTGGSALLLEGVELDVELSEDDDRWSAFSVGPNDRVELVDSVVTLSGSESRSNLNNLFLVRDAAPAIEGMGGPEDPADRGGAGREFAINVDRCVLRGECSLMWVGGGRPGEVNLINSAVSVRESVVVLPGIARGVPADRLPPVKLYLDHVTALFGTALIDVVWKEAAGERPPLLLRVNAYYNAFVNAEDAVLVRMRGGDREADYLNRLDWVGDVNEYLLSEFWRVLASTPDIRHPAESFEQWRALASRRGVFVEDEGPRQRAVQLPADYRMRFPLDVLPETVALAPADDAPAGAAPPAPDGRPVGASADDLPRPADQRAPVRRAAALW